MIALPLVLSCILNASTVYEIDCRCLPPPNTVPDYAFKLAISLAGAPDVPLQIRVGAAAEGQDAAKAIVASLGGASWKVERNGSRVLLFAQGKSRVTKIKVTGDGPKPVVRLLPKSLERK